MFARIDHVGLVAHTIDEARAILGDKLGLVIDKDRSRWPEGSYFAPEQTHNFFFQVGEGETVVEVLIPTAGATSGTARYLAKRGPGLHHICYACIDVHEEAERLRAEGLEEIALPRAQDGRRTVAFFHPRSMNGVLTELVPVRDRPAVAAGRQAGSRRQSSP
ncbi:MAG: methylmalonyl-CoA epimerase [Chloroflexi bacterium]|nr:methylmalonyl-CoA epimerase [Chloroflexota bacterium]